MEEEEVLSEEEAEIRDLSNHPLVRMICMMSIFDLNLSKNVIPNLATIRILSVGTKFIPKSKKENEKDTFRNVEKFRKKLSNTVF